MKLRNLGMYLVVLLALSGCAGSAGMIKADAPPARSDDQATIVFMRSSFVGGAVSSSVFDVTQPQPSRFVGMVQNGTKIAYNVDPGEHTFMVVSEAADFMKANVLPGKTYYVLVTPRMGAFRARFSFRPLHRADLTGPDFADWTGKTELVTSGPEAEAWARNNAPDIEQKRSKYWTEWQTKGVVQQDSQTLNAGDGI